MNLNDNLAKIDLFKNKSFIFSLLSWLLTSVFFLIDPFSPRIHIVALISLAFSIPLCLKNPLLCLYLLPLPLMLGPIFSFPIFGIGFITAGDIYSLFFILRTSFFSNPRSKKLIKQIIGLSLFLLLISCIFSQDLLGSIAGLLKILQYSLLIKGTTFLIRKPEQLKLLFVSWVYITTLCSIIMLLHFFLGRPALISWLNDPNLITTIDLSRSDVLYRPTFFYANIYLPIGLSVIYTFINTLMRPWTFKVNTFLFLLTFPINLFALIINNTKSMLIPVILLCIFILAIYFIYAIFHSIFNFKKIVFFTVFMLLSICFFIFNFLPSTQRTALFDRAINLDSVFLRLSVWESVLTKLPDNTFRLLIGFGPQSTVRQSENPAIKDLLTGTIGNTEGAFDSTIIGFLVEYGLIFSMLIFFIISVKFLIMINSLLLLKDIATLSLVAMSAALICCHIAQQFGLSPPSLFALQIFSIKVLPYDDLSILR